MGRWRYGKVFVLLDGSAEPLLGVFHEVVASQERNGKGKIGTWWCQVAKMHGFVNDRALVRPGSSRLAAMRLMA